MLSGSEAMSDSIKCHHHHTRWVWTHFFVKVLLSLENFSLCIGVCGLKNPTATRRRPPKIRFFFVQNFYFFDVLFDFQYRLIFLLQGEFLPFPPGVWQGLIVWAEIHYLGRVQSLGLRQCNSRFCVFVSVRPHKGQRVGVQSFWFPRDSPAPPSVDHHNISVVTPKGMAQFGVFLTPKHIANLWNPRELPPKWEIHQKYAKTAVSCPPISRMTTTSTKHQAVFLEVGWQGRKWPSCAKKVAFPRCMKNGIFACVGHCFWPFFFAGLLNIQEQHLCYWGHWWHRNRREGAAQFHHIHLLPLNTLT